VFILKGVKVICLDTLLQVFILKGLGRQCDGVPVKKGMSERGYPPPIKMDRYQNKRVARRAFCKLLNRKRMDDGRFCYLWYGGLMRQGGTTRLADGYHKG
jgi:hypothetical protein